MIMRHSAHGGGSDAILVGAKPHPRAWGTFPRYLGHYVRELGVLGLEECVQHLTGRPAARLRLVDRGLVRVGQHADLVVTVCRTGYTGERGYELIAPNAAAPALWDALTAAGGRPCGLGARDTLRTEMGYPLHGQDLSLQITPVQARCGWAVGWKKPAFWGREALLAEREAGPARLLWGLEALDRGIPRPHLPVLAGDTPVGEVTSGTFSPTFERPIAMGFAKPTAAAPGSPLAVDIRGQHYAAQVVPLPFYQRGK